MTSSGRQRNWSPEKTDVDTAKGSKRICIPIEPEEYEQVVDDKKAFRQLLDRYIEQYPELFPADIGQGYKLHGMLPASKKMPEVHLRRIQLKAKAQVLTIAPCFVLPYMTGYTDQVEKVLFLYEKCGL